MDGYINNRDSNWSIITNNTLRDWSLIMGREGYKMGKLWVQNFLRPPQDRVIFFAPPPFKVRHRLGRDMTYVEFLYMGQGFEVVLKIRKIKTHGSISVTLNQL